MIDLGGTVERLRRICLPYMTKLQHFCGETINLGVLDGSRSGSGSKIGAVASFALAPGTEVLARVGISYVDVAGGRAKRLAELPDL